MCVHISDDEEDMNEKKEEDENETQNTKVNKLRTYFKYRKRCRNSPKNYIIVYLSAQFTDNFPWT